MASDSGSSKGQRGKKTSPVQDVRTSPQGQRGGHSSGKGRGEDDARHDRGKSKKGWNPGFWALAGLGGVATYIGGCEVAVRMMGCEEQGCRQGGRGVGLSREEQEVEEEARRQSYEQGAGSYDREVCSGEGMMGMDRLRRKLLARARGRVLEVAAGTGANFPLYPEG